MINIFTIILVLFAVLIAACNGGNAESNTDVDATQLMLHEIDHQPKKYVLNEGENDSLSMQQHDDSDVYPCLTCDSNGKEVAIEDKAYQDSLIKLVEESRKLEKELIASKQWYDMPLSGFIEKVTEQDIRGWKKQMQTLREENGFIVPMLLFYGESLQDKLLLADFFNYLYTFSIYKPFDIDYKLIRYYANLAFPNTEKDNKNEFTRVSKLSFQLNKMAYFLDIPHFNYSQIETNMLPFYWRKHRWMYNEILCDSPVGDYCLNKYKRNFRNKPLQRKEFELFEKHIEMISGFQYSFGNDLDVRLYILHTMAYQSDRGYLYSNRLRDVAYSNYYLANVSSPELYNEYNRISTDELNATIDGLKSDLLLCDSLYSEVYTKVDDLRFIEMYKQSLNKWLSAREKVFESLTGDEKNNYLLADNEIRYFCLMHIKNAFQFFISEDDDYYDAWYVNSIYDYQYQEDSVRFGKNWFQKRIDLEKEHEQNKNNKSNPYIVS